jgi:DNA-binding GntR family transcriptional regulator
MRFSGMLRDQTARYRQLSLLYAESIDRDVPGEHRALLEAALARDCEQACALLSEHYETTTLNVLKHERLSI